jgi:hypothetical protein
MATLLKVLNNLADIKSAGGVALRVRTQDLYSLGHILMKEHVLSRQTVLILLGMLILTDCQ